MKTTLVSLLGTLFLATATVGATEISAVDLRAANAGSATSVTEVLTPQAIERQARVVAGVQLAPPMRMDVEAPKWTPGQVWLLGMVTAIACNAYVTHCAGPAMPIPLAPPVGDAWRIEACKAENTCPAFAYPLRTVNP